MGTCLSSVLRPATSKPKQGVQWFRPGDGVTGAEMRETLLQATGVKNAFLFVGDANVQRLRRADVERFLREDATDALGYVAERRDCDDYAMVLLGAFRKHVAEAIGKDSRSSNFVAGVGFGFLWGDLRTDSRPDVAYAHAMNCFVDTDDRFWLVEPQNDRVQKLHENSRVDLLVM